MFIVGTGRVVPLLLLYALLVGYPAGLAAQPDDDPLSGAAGGKVVDVPRMDADPVIDGILNEEVWSRATVVDDFHQVNPTEYAEPSEPTVVRLFYTRDALYVGARMYETDPDLISANVLRQGQGLQADDIFVLILDPFLDRRNGYQFEVNANGLRVEGLFQNITEVQRDWTGIWQTQAVMDEQGWTVEIRIPFKTIAFNPDTDAWGINFRRSIRRKDESMAWVSRNRQVNPSVAGTASGFEGMRQGMGLDVVPSLTTRRVRKFSPSGSTEEVEPQLDVFYRLTSQLNAALTINTDFSATEVDDRQVNLTRFSLFFPEKREFFLREADIFEFGQIGSGDPGPAISGAANQNGRPFFSRTIGLSTRGEPVDIRAGGKLSGRIGRWNVGSLLVSQDEDIDTGVDDQYIFVGRAAANVLSESQVGIMVTNGDPQSNLDNTLVGADFRYRNSNLPGGRTVQGVAWYQQTDTDGKSGNDSAYGFVISTPNNTGWRGEYSYKRIEENFDPAVGFVNQTGIEDQALNFGYRHFFRPGGYFRSIFTGFDGYRSEVLEDGRVNSQNIGWRVSGNNNFGDGMFMRVIRSKEVLREDFTIHDAPDGSRTVTIPVGDYSFTEGLIGLDLASQRTISGRVTLRWGDFFTGNRFRRQADITWRPSPHFNMDLGYSEDEIHLPEGNFTVRQVTLNPLINFTSTLSWSTLVQYDNVSELIGLNSRLIWIPRAGRQVFLVFNHGVSDRDRDNNFDTVSSDLSLKLNYTLRF